MKKIFNEGKCFFFLRPGNSMFFRGFFSAAFIIFFFSSISQAQVTLRFNDTAPVLETGTALTQGARYRYRNVAPGTDALVTVSKITAGARLVNLDDNTNLSDRFQPVIRTTAANTTAYVRFDFQLVAAGGTTPKIVPSIDVSAQDIDGNNASIREWVEFVNTTTVSVASPTYLVSATALEGGTRYIIDSSTRVQDGIGTNDLFEMYSTNNNTSTFTIVGGNVSGNSACSGTACDRQNSYFFGPLNTVASDVSITKTGPSSIVQNNNITYTLVAQNNGPGTAHGSTVNDNVSTSLTNVTISCTAENGAVCPSTAGLTALSNVFIPTFPLSGKLTFTIIGKAANLGTVTNVATIASPNGSTDPVPANNTSSTVTTQVTTPPNIGLVKSCPTPSNCSSVAQLPGTDLTYKIVFTNSGGSSAANLAIVDSIPVNTDYKIGSAAVNTGTTGLTFVIEFSDDYSSSAPASATWVYVPVSGGGGASANYDRNVKAVRWRVTNGTLSGTSPNNTGDVSFITKIR